jgi:hypothetical protein
MTSIYLFGFSLIMSYLECMTSPLTPNLLFHLREFPTPEDGYLRPNLDTLYSSVRLDLYGRNVNLTLPDTVNYFVAPVQDSVKDVFSLGWRTTGKNQRKVLIGQSVNDDDDEFDVVVSLGSTIGFILLRTNVIDMDYDTANHQQDNYLLSAIPYDSATSSFNSCGLLPTSQYYNNSLNITDAVEDIINMSSETFYQLMMDLLILNPPDSIVDEDIIDVMERDYNMIVGQPWSFSNSINEDQRRELEQMQHEGSEAVRSYVYPSTPTGWLYLPLKSANFSDDYYTRACIAYKFPYPNLSNDSVYFDSGIRYGDHRLVFLSSMAPPNDAFWSVTVYDSNGYLYANPYNKYNLNSQSSQLIVSPDGSISIAFSHTPPTTAVNWIPIPNEQSAGYEVYLRVYWPADDVLAGTWIPPELQPI